MDRVLIVEDEPDTREWVKRLAETAFPGCSAELAGTAAAGLAAFRDGTFDLALVDIGLPDGSGIEVMRTIKAEAPAITGVVLTILGEDAKIVAALAAGSDGYLLKSDPPERIVRQLSQIAEGVPPLSPSIARRIMEHFRYTGPAAAPEYDLTARETEVLALTGRGLRNADVAISLDIAESTVASHIKAIYRKLGISTRAEASWHASLLGLRPGGEH